jgi:hypothetical protein
MVTGTINYRNATVPHLLSLSRPIAAANTFRHARLGSNEDWRVNLWIYTRNRTGIVLSVNTSKFAVMAVSCGRASWML